MSALFYTAAVVAVLASALAVTRTHAVHALLYLVLSLLSVALVFLALGAPFLAALQVIIYAGAIMVLFLFAMMMLSLGARTRERERRWLPPRAWVVPLLLGGALAAAGGWLLPAGAAGPAGDTAVAPVEVARSLYTDYVIGVELASLLLLAGLVGAWYVGSRRVGGDAEPMRAGAEPESPTQTGALGAGLVALPGTAGLQAIAVDAAAGVPVAHALLLAAALVALGAFGVLLRRNLLFMLLSLEVALNGVAVAFVAAGARWGAPDGQVMALFVLTMSAAEVAIGLALVLQIHRRTGSLDVDRLDLMRG